MWCAARELQRDGGDGGAHDPSSSAEECQLKYRPSSFRLLILRFTDWKRQEPSPSSAARFVCSFSCEAPRHPMDPNNVTQIPQMRLSHAGREREGYIEVGLLQKYGLLH